MPGHDNAIQWGKQSDIMPSLMAQFGCRVAVATTDFKKVDRFFPQAFGSSHSTKPDLIRPDVYYFPGLVPKRKYDIALRRHLISQGLTPWFKLSLLTCMIQFRPT